jgi:hypothetical protein
VNTSKTGYQAGTTPTTVTTPVDGREYRIEVYRRNTLPREAPRLIIVAYQSNSLAAELLRVCLDCIARYTAEPHEVWVVDNNSPREHTDWLIDRTDVNVALNRTEPLPREMQCQELTDRGQMNWGSYANAIGLELGTRLITPGSHYVMTMHMDTAPCRAGWLSYLRSKIHGTVGAAGVRMDKTRTSEGVLHVLGYMVDFRLFQQLGLDFFPELPGLDVGDRVTVELRNAGYDVFACPNTVWEPQLAERIPESSPLRLFHADRSFDDEGNVIFLHLGRGLRRSIGEHRKGPFAEDWIRLAHDFLLAE